MQTSDNPFNQCSAEYGRFRPAYPAVLIDDIVACCRLDSSTRILDVGAGTGKASAPFVQRGIPVISVEPSAPMLERGLQSYPDLTYVQAMADKLPFDRSSAAAILCAQSFHWFSTESALQEFARVLETDGHLAVFWNTRQQDAPHIAAFEELVVRFNPAHDPYYRVQHWASRIEQGNWFRCVDHRRSTFTVPMTIDDWIGLSRSISYICCIGEDNLKRFEADLRQLLLQFEDIDCPYETNLWIARRV